MEALVAVSPQACFPDEIDNCHYPVFHQMEGVKLFPVDQVGYAYVTGPEW